MYPNQQRRTGRTIYRASSYAPTRGTVDPTGYIQRELRKRGVSNFGADGQSDTRSGLAQRSLNRSPTLTPVGQPQAKGRNTNKTSQGASNAPTPASTVPTTPAVTTPVVNVSPTGQIQLTLPAEDASNLDAIQKQAEMQQALLELQQEHQNQALAYQQNIAAAAKAYEDQQLARTNDSSGRGLGFSSAHGVGVVKDSEGYNTAKNTLDTGWANFQNQNETAKNSITTAFQNYLAGLAQERAANADAASMGVPTTSATSGAPDPSKGHIIDKGGIAWKPPKKKNNKPPKKKGKK